MVVFHRKNSLYVTHFCSYEINTLYFVEVENASYYAAESSVDIFVCIVFTECIQYFDPRVKKKGFFFESQ